MARMHRMDLDDMTSDDIPIINSWFRHDEASVDTSWFPPGFRVDDELSQPHAAKLLKRTDRVDETVELISAHEWVVRCNLTHAPIGWICGEVWPCHDFNSDIVDGQLPDDVDDMPCATFQLSVAPSHRGRGYGTAMLTAIATNLQLKGTQIWLGIDVKNMASRIAADRAGFDHQFTTAHYKMQSGHDIRIGLYKHMMHFRHLTTT
ncbi:GNAT family N-acetyltransferase [Nocardia sp. NPDC050378]|uniref:GNAT family N-acetyltransferase n=1 Tax=Nocardia sp. NPDC050378 TaxID=3155400 RepID=UPI0033CED2F0